jgi:hydroxyethylthiazole kinase-like uncharacterized protein yjeF
VTHEVTSSFGSIKLTAGGTRPWLAPSAAEMARCDAATIEQGTSGLELMERAGAAVAERILTIFPIARTITIVCGPGNNGGDGLVIARILRKSGLQVAAVLAQAERYSSECEAQRSKTPDVTVFKGSESDQRQLTKMLAESDVVVDAVLGTGQREAPRGIVGDLVRAVQEGCTGHPASRVVAVDIPTGMNADTGAVYNPHIKAHLTLSIEFVKRGMLQFPARAVCGDIETLPIGISHAEACEFECACAPSLPRLVARAPDVHKGALGRVLVVGGSRAMPGAPMLSALGALRSGAGIVTRVIRAGWSAIPPLPEAMYEVLEGDADHFGRSEGLAVAEMVHRYETVVLGPGLGTHADTGAFVAEVLDALRGSEIRAVIDADALNLIASGGMSLSGVPSVLTPHPGEAARLLGCESEVVQSDRFSAVAQLARQSGAVVLLKGAGSLIHDGVRGVVIAEGTPYLATPGSGDVLAGIIAACSVRSQSLYDAAIVGAWVHARAGLAAARKNGGSILASEIAAAVPACMREFDEPKS